MSKPIRSKKLRDAARGMPCTLNVVGVCNYDRDTTVLAHMPDEAHGVSQKASDLSACVACSSCHDWLDRRDFKSVEQDYRQFYMRRAQLRTLSMLYDMGVLSIRGAA